MRLLLVTERTNVFYRKFLDELAGALRRQGVEPVILSGEPYEGQLTGSIEALQDDAFTAAAGEPSARRFTEAFRVARAVGAERLHHLFLADPRSLAAALATASNPPAVTASCFGLGAASREPAVAAGLADVLAHPALARLLLHSIAPDVAHARAQALGVPASPKLAWVHDPLYDPPAAFGLDRASARRSLGLPLDGRGVLYFGTYYRKKGPDLLLAATQDLADLQDVTFWFVGSKRTAPPDLDLTPRPGVLVVDREVDDEEAIRWLLAADLIVQPYRRDYEHDTSGVLVQAAEARRPVVVPALSPFQEVVTRHGLGFTFPCEDVAGLGTAIRTALAAPPPSAASCDAYLAGIESWDALATLISC